MARYFLNQIFRFDIFVLRILNGNDLSFDRTFPLFRFFYQRKQNKMSLFIIIDKIYLIPAKITQPKEFALFVSTKII